MKFVSIDIPYVSDKYLAQVKKLEGIESVTVPVEAPATDEEVVARIGDAELITSDITVKLTKSILSQTNVKAIFCQAVGFDNVDIEYCRRNAIRVYNCAGFNSTAVAEFAFALITSLFRQIPAAQAHVKAGGWSYRFFVGKELNGRTIGIIGSGNVAQKVASIAVGYGMNVLSQTEHPTTEKAVKMHVDAFVPLEKLLARSHIVVLAVPLSLQTKHLIGKDELAQMRSDAILVNVARQTIVDEMALADAVLEGRIAGAVLDMMFTEPFNVTQYPMKIQELVRLPNVIVTPHIAGVSEESGESLGKIFVANVKNYLAGDLTNCVSC
jgi:D-3-phosphoglycerate dehydrogenase